LVPRLKRPHRPEFCRSDLGGGNRDLRRRFVRSV